MTSFGDGVSRERLSRQRAGRVRTNGRSIVWAGFLCTVLLGFGGAASASSSAPSMLQPGMVVTRGGLSAVVPARGEGVGAEAVIAGGGSISLLVETRSDGRVLITSARTSTAGAPSKPQTDTLGTDANAIQAAPNPCLDRAHNLTTSFWRKTVNWSFRAVSTPTNLTRAQGAAALTAGVSHITHSVNNCGRPDKVSATSVYQGVTSAAPDIGNSVCQNPDGRNVVGFGDLQGSQLALTCWWFRGTVTVEADMKVNKHDFRWTTTTAGCANQYVLQAVATHEFGHVFGLAHVSEATHPELTMSTAIGACDNSPSTLGLGDMLGLEARY